MKPVPTDAQIEKICQANRESNRGYRRVEDEAEPVANSLMGEVDTREAERAMIRSSGRRRECSAASSTTRPASLSPTRAEILNNIIGFCVVLEYEEFLALWQSFPERWVAQVAKEMTDLENKKHKVTKERTKREQEQEDKGAYLLGHHQEAGAKYESRIHHD